MAFFNPSNVDFDGAGMPLITGDIQGRTAEALELVSHSVALLGEVGLSDAEAAEMSAAMKAHDDLAVARIFREATERHVQDMLGARDALVRHESDYDRAVALVRIYA